MGSHTSTANSIIKYSTAPVPLRGVCCSLKVSVIILLTYSWIHFFPLGYILFLYVASKAENGWISMTDKEECSTCTIQLIMSSEEASNSGKKPFKQTMPLTDRVNYISTATITDTRSLNFESIPVQNKYILPILFIVKYLLYNQLNS